MTDKIASYLPSLAPRVLVLMATYNGEEWLEEQLDSILVQHGCNVRLLVRDDGSIDATQQILERRAATDRRIAVSQSTFDGGSAAGNFRALFIDADLDGVDYVALSDQDDIWFPDKIERAITQLTFTGAGGYSAAVEAFWPNQRKRVLAQVAAPRACDFSFEGAGQGCTFLLRSEVFQSIRTFTRNNATSLKGFVFHDWQIYIVVRALGIPWVFDARPSMAYRQHPKNEIGSRDGPGGAWRRIRLLRSGWYVAQVRLALRIFTLAGGKSLFADRLEVLINLRPSFKRRILLTSFVLKYSRRRFSDRLVLTSCALLGWL